MEAVRNSRDMYWQVVAGYPRSPERVRSSVLRGMEAVAGASDRVVEAAVDRVRAHLRQDGMPDTDVQRTLDELRSRMRRVVLTALHQRWRRALEERRRQLE
jgi:hypothetical protein